MEISDLAELDQAGVEIIDAIAYDRSPPRDTSSLARPHAFICEDGKTYWLKRRAQNGLGAELIACRLGHKLGASPNAIPVRLFDGLSPDGVDVSHLVGIAVGIEDVKDAENVKHITNLLKDVGLDPSTIDAASRARVVAFQSLIGVGDTQVIIQFSTGKILSIDHGDVFRDQTLSSFSEPSVTLREIPGVPSDVGRDRSLLMAEVARIESLTDTDLLKVVSRVPDEEGWNANRERRFRIFEWLLHRKRRLREAIDQWLRT